MNTLDLMCEFVKNTNISPFVWRYYINEFNPGWSMSYSHSHEANEIIYGADGYGFIKFEDDVVKINKNNCLIISSKCPHRFYVEKNNKCTLLNIHYNINSSTLSDICFDKELIKDTGLSFFSDDIFNRKGFIKLSNYREIKDIMTRIIREMDNKEDNYDVLVKTYFFELFIVLSRIIKETSGNQEKSSNLYVKKAMQIINEQLHSKLSPEIIANSIHISTDYLLHIFKTHTNYSLMEYVTLKRIHKSKYLLENSSKTISEIASDVGIINSQYFSTLFKKHTEMTPNQYRKISKMSNNSDLNIFE